MILFGLPAGLTKREVQISPAPVLRGCSFGIRLLLNTKRTAANTYTSCSTVHEVASDDRLPVGLQQVWDENSASHGRELEQLRQLCAEGTSHVAALKRFARTSVDAVPRHAFSDWIEIRDVAGEVDTDDPVADRVERDPCKLVFHVQDLY